VLVGSKETVVIGLVPEHMGVRVTHCHILEPAEAGMTTAIRVNDIEPAQAGAPNEDKDSMGNIPNHTTIIRSSS